MSLGGGISGFLFCICWLWPDSGLVVEDRGVSMRHFLCLMGFYLMTVRCFSNCLIIITPLVVPSVLNMQLLTNWIIYIRIDDVIYTKLEPFRLDVWFSFISECVFLLFELLITSNVVLVIHSSWLVSDSLMVSSLNSKSFQIAKCFWKKLCQSTMVVLV